MSYIETEARLRFQDFQHEAEHLHLLHQVPRTPLVHQFAESLRHLADHLDHLQHMETPRKGHHAS
ncbi:hypothetical protein [Deinococcus misasensis]|uniref:hypothetical protein n=1 Tax=Deinococcus misasensis TaxID=392413 RepID=UPI00054F5F33|nr:hypothetical protein [Deinococcus misasensis]